MNAFKESYSLQLSVSASQDAKPVLIDTVASMYAVVKLTSLCDSSEGFPGLFGSKLATIADIGCCRPPEGNVYLEGRKEGRKEGEVGEGGQGGEQKRTVRRERTNERERSVAVYPVHRSGVTCSVTIQHEGSD